MRYQGGFALCRCLMIRLIIHKNNDQFYDKIKEVLICTQCMINDKSNDNFNDKMNDNNGDF